MSDDRQLSQLRRAHPKFMWIAGGHEHYAQHEALTADSALITKGDSNARKVWRVAIGFNDRGVDRERGAHRVADARESFNLNAEGFEGLTRRIRVASARPLVLDDGTTADGDKNQKTDEQEIRGDSTRLPICDSSISA